MNSRQLPLGASLLKRRVATAPRQETGGVPKKKIGYAKGNTPLYPPLLEGR